MRRRTRAIPVLATLLALTLAAPVGAQEGSSPSPLSDFVVTGYGSVGLTSVINPAGQGNFSSDFSASVSPVLLFNMGNDFLFEAEFEYELAGAETVTTLEYAQVDYLGFENVQITAGKFLLPFGLFSERLHPSWINKLPSMPLLYGHAHGGVVEGALLPVLSDIGVMGRWAQPLGEDLTLDVTAWITQGPRPAAEEEGDAGDGHAHNVAAFSRSAATGLSFDVAPTAQLTAGDVTGIPAVAYGINTSDNNDNKMLGLRAGLVAGGDYEVYLSGFHSMYDAGDFLDLYGGNLAFEWRPGPYEVRGEGAVVWQELLLDQAAVYETKQSPGYYLQASRRVGPLEPVVRWSHLLDSEVGSTVVRDRIRQLAVGMNYWLSPSIPVKAAFEWNMDGRERMLVQWAYGF